MKVILPIKPQYAEKIFSGEKTYELRKQLFKYPITHVIVYATAPISKVIGEFEVSHIIAAHPIELWNMIRLSEDKSLACVTKREFINYFDLMKYAFALAIKKPTLFDEPHPLSDYGLTHAPQSFVYYDE